MSAMLKTVIVDATVLLNLLNVPKHNGDRGIVLQEFNEIKKSESGSRILLPVQVAIQAGDHIADLPNGSSRWLCAGVLRDQVRKALRREAPWELTFFPDERSIDNLLTAFPDFAKRGEGYNLSSLSIVKIWDAACKRIPNQRVRIWSLNTRLQGYDRIP